MRGLGDFQRRQMRRGDPRIREVFSRIRQIVDLLEDIANHPHQPLEPEPARSSSPPATPPVPSSTQIKAGEPAPILVSVKEARRLIGISRTGLYALINDGRIETVMIGTRRMIKYASLRQLADR